MEQVRAGLRTPPVCESFIISWADFASARPTCTDVYYCSAKPRSAVSEPGLEKPRLLKNFSRFLGFSNFILCKALLRVAYTCSRPEHSMLEIQLRR